MFILTPSASLGYEATENYLDYIQGNVKSKIQLVICLDQLISSDSKSTTLHVYDSYRSSKSSIRDAFVHSMRGLLESGASEYLTDVVEWGVLDAGQVSDFVPFEHIAYAKKGITAITISLRDKPYQSREEKFSLLDRDLCLCKLSKVLFTLNEAIAQTIVAPDLGIEGELLGSGGILPEDKMYLR